LEIDKNEDSRMWHYIYGHLRWKGLNTLIKKQMVKGLPELEEIEGKCKYCLL